VGSTRRARKRVTKEGRGRVGKTSSEASAWPESRGGAPRVAGGREVRGRRRRRGVAWAARAEVAR
jgi:hypothetical protein